MAFYNKTRSSASHTKWLQQINEQVVVYSISDRKIRNQFQALGLSVEELKNKIFETSESLVAISQETNASVEELLQKSMMVSNQGKQTAEQSKTSQTLAKDGQKQLFPLKNRFNPAIKVQSL